MFYGSNTSCKQHNVKFHENQHYLFSLKAHIAYLLYKMLVHPKKFLHFQDILKNLSTMCLGGTIKLSLEICQNIGWFIFHLKQLC